MKSNILKISKPASSILHELSAIFGVSAQEYAWRFLERKLLDLKDDVQGLALLAAEEAKYELYVTQREAEAVAERINELSMIESLEGKSQFTVSAEVIKRDGCYGIESGLLHPNAVGWVPVE